MIALIRRQTAFKLQRLLGSSVEECYREFLTLERRSPAEIQSLQSMKLEALLRHAAKVIPFYRERALLHGSPAPGEFPIVTKSALRDHYREFMNDGLRAAYDSGERPSGISSWIEVQTGGSTGMPTSVIHDRDFRDRGRASRLYSQYLSGFPFGTPYFRLWGSMRDINEAQESPGHRVMNKLAGEVLFNAFRMEKPDMNRYLAAMRGSAIRHMMAYVDAGVEMALYASNSGQALPQLDSVMACAGTVTPEVRETISRSFQARVHNKYGSRDCADMACECSEGGMHIFSHNVFIEVVNEAGNPAAAGTPGRILVTLLSNGSFPLIRYEIGDIGVLSQKPCRCGRPFPLFERIEGRTVEFLRTAAGGYVSPVYIRHLIGVVHNTGFIRRFQFIQESPVRCLLKLEIEAGADEVVVNSTLAFIKRDLSAVFGQKCDLAFERVARINESDSGKFLYTINRMEPA